MTHVFGSCFIVQKPFKLVCKLHTMWKVFLILLLLGTALEYAGARKPPKKPAKVKGCIGENGKLYKKGESVQEECYTKTCLYRRRKWFWKSRPNTKECCAYSGAYVTYAPFGTYYVPNGWTEWKDGKLYVCTNGKLEVDLGLLMIYFNIFN